MWMMLNSKKALSLYLLLKDHFPTENSDLENSEFDFIQVISIIISSMREKGQAVNYHRSLMLMFDVSFETIQESDPEDLLSMFADGLVENNVVELMSFFGEKVQYGIH